MTDKTYPPSYSKRGYQPKLGKRFTNCLNCGKELSEEFQRKRRHFCSDSCKSEARQKRYRQRNPRPIISTGTTGAISELRVAIDLLNKGYSVFRSVTPNCSCDIAILKDNKLIKVEIKTGYYSETGKIQRPTPLKTQVWDILAIVLYDKIIYIPDLTEMS